MTEDTMTDSADVTPARGARTRAALVLTEVFAPWVIVVLLPLAVAWQATHRVLPALGWGLLVAATSSILPMGVIVWGARTGRWDSHHVRDRAGRAVPFLALIVMSLVGLGLLVALGAPWSLIALDIAMIGSLFVTGAITVWWKVSMHSAVASGAVVILALLYHPAWWALMVLVAAISWSRVQIRDHTTAQVTGGAIIGAAVGGGLFAALLYGV
ncbi:phosphatase PAP2 family protein [Saccharopolyspora tripterygii]